MAEAGFNEFPLHSPEAGIAFSHRQLGEVVLGASDIKVPKDVTPRQLFVIEEASLGHSRAQTAETNHCSEETIKTHRTHAMERLGVHTMPHAVRLAIEKGYLQIEDKSEQLHPRLTNREYQVLYFVSIGYETPKIAETLHISRNTVNQFRKGIHLKLETTTMSQAVREAFEFGILQPELAAEEQ